MNKKVKKEFTSTYEKLIHEDPDFEKDLNKGYQEFILSELILALMQEDHVTVRKLAKEAGVSPSLIQDLKKSTNNANLINRLLSFFSCFFGIIV